MASDFAAGCVKRIRTAVILGALWVTAIALALLLLPYLEQIKHTTWNLIPYAIGSAIIRPAFYGLTAAFFASLLAIRGDFRIESRVVRIILLALGFALVAFYYYFVPFPYGRPGASFFYDHFDVFWMRLYETPALFYVPGALLFCGFNRKPTVKQRARLK